MTDPRSRGKEVSESGGTDAQLCLTLPRPSPLRAPPPPPTFLQHLILIAL